MFYFKKVDVVEDDKQKMIEDVMCLYNTGEICYDVPKYQTYPTLFEKEQEHWVRFKKMFLESVGGLVCNKKFESRAWAYISIPQTKFHLDREREWHIHQSPYEEIKQVISGIFYLSFPQGSNTTEFLINNNIEKLAYRENSWLLFPGFLTHRPGLWKDDVELPRIVIAADFYF